MTDPAVQITGLREVKAALKAVDKDAPKEMAAGFKEIAARVARSAAGKVPSITGTAASSIKPRGSTNGGAIAFGGPRAPYYPWLDFGGSVGRSKSVKRPFIQKGRYVYPTIAAMEGEIVGKADELIETLVRRHNLDTRGT